MVNKESKDTRKAQGQYDAFIAPHVETYASTSRLEEKNFSHDLTDV